MRPLQTTEQNENRHFDEFHWPGRDYSWISFNKILIIGLGQLGLPVAKYVKDRGFDVYGYDISTKAIERAEKTAGIKKLITLADLMFILYVFQHINKKICFHLK